MEDERLYEIAAKELEVNAPRKGLFARAFSEAMGEDGKARAIYIRLRVDQLREHLKQPKTEERGKAEEAARQEIERQRRPVSSTSGASDCVAALEERGFRVDKVAPDSWEIRRPRDGSSVHAYGEAHLRELTAEFVWEQWSAGLQSPDAEGIDSRRKSDGSDARTTVHADERIAGGPMRYVAAVAACFAIWLVWIVAGNVLFGWKHGGGAIPTIIIITVVVFVWRAIVRRGVKPPTDHHARHD